MRLTRAGEYALRCMLHVASKEAGEVVLRKEIAEAMDIPEPFLAKIAQQLKYAGIIEIVQGPGGGFKMLIPPEKLTPLDVVEAVIGEISLNDCVVRPQTCERSPVCPIHRMWERTRERMRASLGENSFAELLNEQSCLVKAGKKD